MRNRLQLGCFMCIVAVSGMLCHSVFGGDQSAEPFRVVLLHSTSTYLPAAIIVDQAMRESLSANARRNVELYVESLDTIRFPAKEFEPEFLRLLRLKFQKRKIDLLMPEDADALDFAQRYRAQIWPGVPIVFYSVAADSFRERDLQPDVTGVILPFDLSETIKLAMQLQPTAPRIVVVSGTSSYDQDLMRRARAALDGYKSRLDISFWTDQLLSDLLDALRKLPANTIVLYLTFSRDADGKSYVPRDIARALAAASSAPIYGVFETYIGQGVVGGTVASLAAHGKFAGEIAARVLGGERAGEMPLQPSPPAVPTIDWRQLQRWGFSENNLPPGAIVQFRELTFWQLYHRQLLGVGAVVILQSLLIVALLVQRAKRRRGQDELQRNEAALQASYKQVRDLAGRLITAQEAERSRIAGELHDDVNQQLAGLSIALSNVKRQLPRGANGTVQEEIARLQHRTGELADVIRHLSHEMHPGVLQHAGLVAALRGHCTEFGTRHAIEVTLSAPDGLDIIPDDVALCLYRVVQEALRNCAEHSCAHRAQVTLSSTEDVLELTIADDGQGFDLAEAQRLGGLGLISLDERVRLVGGSFAISTQPQHGTELRVQVPWGGNQ